MHARLLAVVAAVAIAARVRFPARAHAPDLGNVLVYGDSQAGGLGRSLAGALPAATVDVVSHSGVSTNGLADRMRAGRYDTVFLFAGDNDGANGPSDTAVRHLVQTARSRTGATRLYWIGPSPTTLIGDTSIARRVWGSAATDVEYWTRRGYAPVRKAALDRVSSLLATMGVQHLRLDDMGLGGIRQPSGVTFPTLPDGLHYGPAVSSAAARAIIRRLQ